MTNYSFINFFNIQILDQGFLCRLFVLTVAVCTHLIANILKYIMMGNLSIMDILTDKKGLLYILLIELGFNGKREISTHSLT